MRLTSLLLALGLAALPLTAATAQDAGSTDLASIATSLEQEIERLLDETGIPSVSLALIREGQVVWASAYGYANVGAGVPATADTYYCAGSTFKLVTATAVMQLVERGELTLDTPLNELVAPDLAVEGADDVTVRHLLSHRSGLDAFALARRADPEGSVSMVPLWSRRPSFTPEELLGNTRRTGPPGVAFEYSNDGYAIAGYIVEVVSGQSYDEYVAERVLQPLGVDIDRPSVPSPRVVEHLALPYELVGNAATPVAQVRGDAFAAGDVYLKASDMARFLAAQLNGGEYDGHRILSPASTAEMRRQQFEGRAYGLGVQLASFDGHDIIHHSGGIPGFKSVMVAEPATRQGVYIMANAGGARALGALARHAMQLMWGGDLEPLPSFATKTAVTIDPDVFDEYVGEYAFSADETLTVSRTGTRFYLQPTGRSRIEVLASSPTEYFLHGGGVSFTFGRDDDDGPVTHLILHQDGDRRADRMARVSAAAAEGTSSAEDLPQALTLFARHLEARGGRQALERADTIEVTGKIQIPTRGLDGSVRSRFGPDLRFSSTVDLGPAGTTRQGYDGKVGWIINPQSGTEVLEGDRLKRLKTEANWLADAQYERLFPEMATVAREDFHGFDCYVVEVTSPDGDESRVYFERETGLTRGRDAMAATAAGPTQLITVIRDYREFGDLLVPSRTEVSMPAHGIRPVMTVESVEYDTLAMTVFDR